jgi:hypothetical protein
MRIRFRRPRTTAVILPAARVGDAASSEPVVTGDGTGWVAVHASPSWWRSLPTLPGLGAVTERWAAVGESCFNPGLCRAEEASSGRPCPIDTTSGPCPLHGELPLDDGQPQDELCGQPTKSGRPCRWNVAAKGPCLPHRRVESVR